jgi:hypothetical protein
MVKALEAAEVAMEAAEAMMPAAAGAAAPLSPVMDAPAPPRQAVESGDTEIFDRGRRREGAHTFVAILFC